MLVAHVCVSENRMSVTLICTVLYIRQQIVLSLKYYPFDLTRISIIIVIDDDGGKMYWFIWSAGNRGSQAIGGRDFTPPILQWLLFWKNFCIFWNTVFFLSDCVHRFQFFVYNCLTWKHSIDSVCVWFWLDWRNSRQKTYGNCAYIRWMYYLEINLYLTKIWKHDQFIAISLSRAFR